MKRNTLAAALTAVIALIAMAACSSTPSHVIPPETMAALMADLRMADAVVSINARDYTTDSARYALRQAVFDRNGVTAADFDSSLVWYGHNIGKYQEVTDRSIEILERRLATAGASGAASISISGDSVDLWALPPAMSITRRSPSQYITFSIDADRNAEPGDAYTWRLRFMTPPASAQWSIATEYADGAVEVQTANMTASATRPEMTFYTDTLRRVRNINGWLHVVPDGHRPVMLDSITLVRRRIADRRTHHNYRQILYSSPSERTDTAHGKDSTALKLR